MTEAVGVEDGRIMLDLPLKGERKYLQSANILWDLVSRFSLTGPLKLDFRQMIYHPIYLVPGGPDAPNKAGKFSFKADDTWQNYGIYIDETRSIGARIDNNEAEILANSEIGEDMASCPIGEPANFIDTLVALNKVVVARHNLGKKSIFSALELERVPTKGRIGARMVKKLGSRLFVSDVLCDGSKIGKLVFMAI